jgi:hypothetical protein
VTAELSNPNIPSGEILRNLKLDTNFCDWLDNRFKHPVALSRFSGAKRVEKYYGDLDRHYANDRLNHMLSHLSYSRDDMKRGVPNPSKIPFSDGANLLTGLNTLKHSTKLYLQFRDDGLQPNSKPAGVNAATSSALEAELDRIRELQLAGIGELLRQIKAIVEELRYERDKWHSLAENLELLPSNRRLKSPWRWFVK